LRNSQFRKLLFNIEFFKQNVSRAILESNKTDFTQGITGQEAEYYDNKLGSKIFKDTELVKSEVLMT